MKQQPKTLLGISLPTAKKHEVLEKILKDASSREGFSIVMSLNPEILVAAQGDSEFKKLIQSSKTTIVDGVGVVLAAQMMGIAPVYRYPGVDMMADVLEVAEKRRLGVVLIGGRGNLAERLADCYSEKYPRLSIFGLEGIKNISSPTAEEEEKLFSIVADRKPHIVFLAFGSPAQELWAFRNRARFGKVVVAGVGGAFDFLMGEVPRAPRFVRSLGLEWVFRLVRQPWRWKRQLRLIEFGVYVLRERLGF